MVSVREKRAVKGHFIIIFLCQRLKTKLVSKKLVQYVFFKDFLFSIAFAALFFVFQLIVHTDSGEGVVKQKVDKRGQGGDENWQKCEDILYGRPPFVVDVPGLGAS